MRRSAVLRVLNYHQDAEKQSPASPVSPLPWRHGETLAAATSGPLATLPSHLRRRRARRLSCAEPGDGGGGADPSSRGTSAAPPPLPEIWPRVSGVPSGCCFSPCLPASLHRGDLPPTSGFGPVAAPLQFSDGAAQLLCCKCCCRPVCRRAVSGGPACPATTLLLLSCYPLAAQPSSSAALLLLAEVQAQSFRAGRRLAGGGSACLPRVGGSIRPRRRLPLSYGVGSGLVVLRSCGRSRRQPCAGLVAWWARVTTQGLSLQLLRPGVPGPASSNVHGSIGVLYRCGFSPSTR